uniref:Uncharacterized protein n=1 Tax=Anopheles merus TaxID=30066 RepID=A0A182UY90_ANOME
MALAVNCEPPLLGVSECCKYFIETNTDDRPSESFAVVQQHRAFSCGKSDGKCFTKTGLTVTIFRAESAAAAAGIAVVPLLTSTCAKTIEKGQARPQASTTHQTPAPSRAVHGPGCCSHPSIISHGTRSLQHCSLQLRA